VRNHLGAAVVPVEPWLGHQHADLEISHRSSFNHTGHRRDRGVRRILCD
jgi:hypothetical protein